MQMLLIIAQSIFSPQQALPSAVECLAWQSTVKQLCANFMQDAGKKRL